jgi:hypothetical protein
MAPVHALAAARELAKAYLENQQMPSFGNGAEDSGRQTGQFVVAMVKELAAYFENAKG